MSDLDATIDRDRFEAERRGPDALTLVVLDSDGPITVGLDTDLDDALIAEGLAREVTSRIQRLRKDKGLSITDRITLMLSTTSDVLRAALAEHGEAIADEVLATSLAVVDAAEGDKIDIDEHALVVSLQVSG